MDTIEHHMIPRMIVSQFGDEYHVILEVAINTTVFTRHTLDILDNEDSAYTRAREIIEFLSAIWSE